MNVVSWTGAAELVRLFSNEAYTKQIFCRCISIGCMIGWMVLEK